MAQPVGALSLHQKVAGSILGQGVYGRQPIHVAPSFKSINMSSGEDLKE